jgi:hypothetical protein
LTLDGPLDADVDVPADVTSSDDRTVLRASVTGAHVDRDVARVAAIAAAGGAAVQDIKLGGASLQDVFIALTGRELRE